MYITKKKIRGKEYTYAEHSVRMPNGRKANISKRVPKGTTGGDLDEYMEYFIDKECELAGDWALKSYEFSHPLSEKDVKTVERMRILYKHIMRKVKGKDREDLWKRFVANFTYDSNAIEGNSLTLKDVTMLLFDKEMPKGKNLREVYETRNSKEALDRILKKRYGVSQGDIIALHRVMMRDIDERTGYKRFPNVILSRDVETTPPERVEEEMDELIGFYEQNKGKLHPIRLVSGFHGRFEKIHPFADGNGRVGRFLVLIQLLNQGYPPPIIRRSQRRSYFNALQAFDNGHEAKLVRFILKGYKRTFGKFFKVFVKYL